MPAQFVGPVLDELVLRRGEPWTNEKYEYAALADDDDDDDDDVNSSDDGVNGDEDDVDENDDEDEEDEEDGAAAKASSSASSSSSSPASSSSSSSSSDVVLDASSMEYLDDGRVLLKYLLPWAEVVVDFHDRVLGMPSPIPT